MSAEALSPEQLDTAADRIAELLGTVETCSKEDCLTCETCAAEARNVLRRMVDEALTTERNRLAAGLNKAIEVRRICGDRHGEKTLIAFRGRLRTEGKETS